MIVITFKWLDRWPFSEVPCVSAVENMPVMRGEGKKTFNLSGTNYFFHHFVAVKTWLYKKQTCVLL